MTHRFDVRRGLGLILLIIGLALPVVYFANQAIRPAPRSTLAPTATPIVERLIPTVGPTVAVTDSPAPTRLTRTIVVIAAATATASSTPRATKTATRQIATVATRAVTRITSQAATLTATRAATRTATRTATQTLAPTATPDRSPSFSPTPAQATATSRPVVISGSRWRFGVGVSLPAPHIARLADLGAGWFLDWSSLAPAGRPAGPAYMRMVRLSQGQPRPALTELADIAQRSPGSLWLIGNEPDVIWQDNTTPDQYVQAYHDAYSALKQADPTSRIAIAGVSQPTPLRLQYLDRILALYRERFGEDMPIDVWNVHNFILPEKRGDWGVDIPPGLTASSGLIVDIEDHDNLARFKQQIVDFRRWMAERGFRELAAALRPSGRSSMT